MDYSKGFDSDFDRQVTLASLEATYEYARDWNMPDLQEGCADTFCKLFDIPEPEFFWSVGISTSTGAGSDH